MCRDDYYVRSNIILKTSNYGIQQRSKVGLVRSVFMIRWDLVAVMEESCHSDIYKIANGEKI